MLAQTWSYMYFRQRLERFMDVQYIHFLSVMAFFVFHIFGRISLLPEQTAERHTDNPHVSLFCPSAFWFDQFWQKRWTLSLMSDSWENSDTAADEMDEYERRWPLHDLDLQAPSLLASLTQLLAALFDCDLLVCFLKKNTASIYSDYWRTVVPNKERQRCQNFCRIFKPTTKFFLNKTHPPKITITFCLFDK